MPLVRSSEPPRETFPERAPFPVDRLQPGHCGTVREIRAGDQETFRLKAMGVCRGRRVMMVRSGDPLILRVLGTRVGISARLAGKVYVVACTDERCEAPPP